MATITLDRPERRNAFHFALGAELEAAYARCDEDDAVRAVVLTGAGKAFCVGADMGGGEKTFENVEGGRRAADPGCAWCSPRVSPDRGARRPRASCT